MTTCLQPIGLCSPQPRAGAPRTKARGSTLPGWKAAGR